MSSFISSYLLHLLHHQIFIIMPPLSAAIPTTRLPIDDNIKLTAPQYRERLYQEITNRRRESRKKETAQSTAAGGSGTGGREKTNSRSGKPPST